MISENGKKKVVPWNKGTKGMCKSNKTSFKKGHVPWNKGLKGVCKSNKTSFKKGHVPLNHRPVGSERLSQGYNLIKVAEPNVWVNKARYTWEKTYGKIPENHSIVRLDGDKLNDNIDNLRIVHRGVLVLVNKKFNHILKDKELMNTCLNISELLITLNEKEKAINGN